MPDLNTQQACIRACVSDTTLRHWRTIGLPTGEKLAYRRKTAAKKSPVIYRSEAIDEFKQFCEAYAAAHPATFQKSGEK